MSEITIEGIVPILVTPFDEDGQIDEDSLENLVEHSIAAGVHGLGIAIGSEIFKLTETERDRLTRHVSRAIGNRVPFVVNVSAAGTDLAIHYARMAEAGGAEALMAMPPAFFPVQANETIEHFRRLGGATGLPIVLQDVFQAPIAPALAMRIAEVCPTVHSLKVETPPVTPRLAEACKAVDGRLTVFGGAGGAYFVEELRRGARGTMPFCTMPEVYLDVWRRFGAGDEAGARRVFDTAFIALNRLTAQTADMFFHVHKQLLVRQGLIRTAHVRGPTSRPDAKTQEEIDTVLGQVMAGLPPASSSTFGPVVYS